MLKTRIKNIDMGVQKLARIDYTSRSATGAEIRAEKMVASVEGDLEYICQKYYPTEDCTGEVIHTASKKYLGCNPYLFEVEALGKYYDMLGGTGHCLDNKCTVCEVSAEVITEDKLVGGKNPICRSRKYVGVSDDTTPTWSFHAGPCPNMCDQFYAKHPGCDESYDGDLPCQPTQEEIDYAPQCFKLLSLTTASKITWENAGYGSCNGRKWRKIGTARSLQEAKELMLSDSRCNSDQSMLFFSRSWDVRCATAENHKDCTKKNKNWQKYILRIESEDTEWCPNSAKQRCRMQCSKPTCSEGQCALRDGTCCDYNCKDNSANTALARTNERLRQANTALRNALESLAAN